MSNLAVNGSIGCIRFSKAPKDLTQAESCGLALSNLVLCRANADWRDQWERRGPTSPSFYNAEPQAEPRGIVSLKNNALARNTFRSGDRRGRQTDYKNKCFGQGWSSSVESRLMA